jgi:hypothetical protein
MGYMGKFTYDLMQTMLKIGITKELSVEVTRIESAKLLTRNVEKSIYDLV